jgi:hypothetical protein
MQVQLGGMINVSFYDQQAGYTQLKPVTVQARAQPQVSFGALHLASRWVVLALLVLSPLLHSQGSASTKQE